RLPDIVQQRSPCQGRRTGVRQLLKQQQGVHKNVALGMELRRLLDALHRGNLRQDFAEEASLVEQEKGLAGVALGKHFGQFVANSFTRDLMNSAGQLRDRGKRFRLDGVSEARGKTHRTQHAQLIFGKAQLGPADGANDSGSQVLAPAYEIQHFIPDRIEQQAVDVEVPSLDIFLSTLAEAYLVRMAAITEADVAAECGDLDAVAARVSHRHQHYTKLCAHRVGFRKDAHDLVGSGVAGDVVVS